MIDRCDHGDVVWDGIREEIGAHGSAVGTCQECGAAVAASLSCRYAITAAGDDGDHEKAAVIGSGPA